MKKEFQIEEGKSAVLTIGVNAYPEVSLDDYTWEKDSVPRIQIPRLNRTVSGTRLAAEGGSLTFNNVVLGDQGNYILSVKNEVGTSTANIKVAILHPPRYWDAIYIFCYGSFTKVRDPLPLVHTFSYIFSFNKKKKNLYPFFLSGSLQFCSPFTIIPIF